jgi:hypothetical protein
MVLAEGPRDEVLRDLIQDSANEFPRKSIPRTRVNKGIKRVGATIPWPFLA